MSCSSCGSHDVTTDRQVEDCRHNGDAYGTEIVTCKKCGYSQSHKFDDAAETYYYETAYSAHVSEPVKPQNEPLTPEQEVLFAKMVKIKIPSDGIRQAMVLRKIREEDIEAFMLKHNLQS